MKLDKGRAKRGKAKMVAPRTGAWIETFKDKYPTTIIDVAPRTGAWIETRST